MPYRTLFTSESITQGHPDKVCDQISDAVLDACFAADPASRVACETFVAPDRVVVGGEITTKADLDVDRIVRDTVRRIGYTEPGLGFDADSVQISNYIVPQSADIALGVDEAYENSSDEHDDVDHLDEVGAGDQGLMFGYACDETPALMPLPIHLAHRLSEKLRDVREDGTLGWLRPDGKTQVTVAYEEGKPVGIDTALISTHHDASIEIDDLRAQVEETVIRPLLPEGLDADDVRVLVNPTGRFEIGGPQADAGLTGRKIIADTYGGMARHGGGAFSGKDCTKVDRSAAYATRWVAKHIVAAGLAEKAELQVAYAIGVARPVSVSLDCFGTEQVDPELILKGVESIFDLRPAAIIADLDLRRPIYSETAAYGHFGRTGESFPWEDTSRVDDLRSAVGAG